MSRCVFTIMLFILAQFVSYGQEREHLLPLKSNIDMPDVLIKYEQTLRDHLGQDKDKAWHGMLARVIVQSSLPFSLQINRFISLDKDTTYFLTYKQSTINIWKKVYNNINISDSDIKKNCVEISQEDAQLIGTLFEKALLTTRYPDAKNIKIYELGYDEGTMFLFSTFYESSMLLTSYSESDVDAKPRNGRISELENICLEIKLSLANTSSWEKYVLPVKIKEKIKMLIERFNA